MTVEQPTVQSRSQSFRYPSPVERENGLASTLRMCTAISPGQWQPWTAVSALLEETRRGLAMGSRLVPGFFHETFPTNVNP